MTPTERTIRLRLRDSLEYYAPRCLKIRTKSGAIEPLRLNQAQRHTHKLIEAQLATTGRVRVLGLKGRQQGFSTYTEGQFFHKATHRPGTRAFILTHLDEATNNLFGMTKRFYEHCPEVVRPSIAASNAKELVFDKLDSSYKVSTCREQRCRAKRHYPAFPRLRGGLLAECRDPRRRRASGSAR